MEYNSAELLKLDGTRNREIFARATVLDRYERPIETIEGKLTGGSINVDGNSAVRRSFSLSMTAKDVSIHNAYWSLRHKIKLEIGVRNLTEGIKSPIYWFKQGIYVLTEFRAQQSVNNFTISMSGKDKMCLLNGEVGGIFTSQTDVGQIETTTIDDDGTEITTIEALKISTIIKEMLIGIGGELPQNIILNNVDDYGVELLVYIGSEPLYVMLDISTSENYNMPNKEMKDYNIGNEINSSEWYYNNELITSFEEYQDQIPSLSNLHDTYYEIGDEDFVISKDNINYVVFKVETHQVCGYRLTGLIYPGGELIANVGESITSILDKIKNQFGTFEYFYDLDGHFVWQLKKLYANTSYNTRTDYTLQDTESYVENPYQVLKYSYYFNNNNLLTAINDNPQLGNLKNDFSIWGVNANEQAIHLRYAIDIKPIHYVTYDGIEYKAGELTNEIVDIINTGKELINAQKQEEEYGKELDENFTIILNKQADGQELTEEEFLFISGSIDDLIPGSYWYLKNQSEDKKNQISQDIALNNDEKIDFYRSHCDWRELIYQMAADWFKYYHHGGVTDTDSETADEFIQVLQQRNPDYESLVLYGRTGYEQYYTDLEGFWRYLYNPFASNEDMYDPITGFNKLIEEDPEALVFYFDFLDADTSDIGNYAIPYIGDRAKTSNNNAIKVIKYRDIPNVLYYWNDIDPEEESAKRTAEGYYTIWFNPDDMEGYVDIAARTKSCYDELDNFLYNYTYINQSISLTSIPIYRLEPNTLIYIKDETNDINGEYAINRMTIPLTFNGTMSITANRIPQRLY